MLASPSTTTDMKSTSVFLYEEKDLVHCTYIAQLLHNLGVPQYQPEDWRMFIDSSKQSLKCVLCTTTLKEKYETVKYMLQKICYDHHEWDICVDLRMVNFLSGQQVHQVNVLSLHVG